MAQHGEKEHEKLFFHWEIIDETRRTGPRDENQWKILFRSKGDSRAREKKEDAIFPSHSLTTFEPGWLRKIFSLRCCGGRKSFPEILFLVLTKFSHSGFTTTSPSSSSPSTEFSFTTRLACVSVVYRVAPSAAFSFIKFSRCARDERKSTFVRETNAHVKCVSDRGYAVRSPDKSFLHVIAADGLVLFLSRPEKRFGGALGWPRFRPVTASSALINPPGFRRRIVFVSSLIAPHFQRI